MHLSKVIHPMIMKILVLIMFVFEFMGQIVSADDVVLPYYFSNQNPFIQIFVLPRAEPHVFLPKKSLLTITSLDIVNNTVQGKTKNETLILDGETYRFNFAMKYGLTRNINLNFDLPIVKHASGRFDNFIRNWHDFFGLSNREQEQFEPNQLQYLYSNNGIERVNISSNQQGVGDARLAVTYKENETQSKNNIIYRLYLKLPTGNAEKLLGSGAVDVGFSASTQSPTYLKEYYSGIYGQLGFVWLGKSDLFEDVQRRLATFGSATIDWDYWRPVVFKAQLDIHSAYYRSDIVDLGGNSVQLTVGGTIELDKKSQIDIGVTENLMTDATPDIGLNLSYWSRFD
jgi:hypothetical protein